MVTLTLFSRSYADSVDEIFSELANIHIYLLDKTKLWVGFGDLDPIFKVTGEFSGKICLDGFHLTRDRYIVRTSQRCD